MTNNDFDNLISMPKQFTYPKNIILPQDKQAKIFKVRSITSRDSFLLDYDRRGSFCLKHKTQLRLGKDALLVRLEINGPPHINPDGRTLSRNHIHIYRENYDMKWAYELTEIFAEVNLRNLNQTNVLNLFTNFCDYCKIDLSDVPLQGVL